MINPLSAILHVLAIVAVAGIVHIVAIFEAPLRAPRDAFARLALLTPVNAMAPLAAQLPDANAIPFRDPAMVSAVCRFDLTNGPVQVVLEPIDRGFLALGMHSRHGRVFYGLNVGSTERTEIVLTLMTAAQKEARDTQAEAEDSGRDLLVIAPERQGFIMVDTPAGESGSTIQAEANLGRVSCGTGRKPEPVAP